ncbi:MAG TPA: 16S rRNA (cytidine(1402)-2'-O)-methyltransferase, partial [Myxococcota bacterium]
MSTSKLAVVATPIGNLADLAPRAAEALKSADLVLCEDTRHSKPLLDRLASQARLVSCHQHNERERAAEVIVALREGKRVALISDAGAPGVSDPGSRLIEDVVAAGCAVEVFPGPSALTAALMGAGIDVSRFVFLGFLPRSGGGRSELLAFAARSNLGVVIYEAPHRVADTLTDLAQAFAARRVVVARELTKLHETFHRGTLGGALSPPFVDKGEAVILIEAAHDAVPRDDIGQAIDVDAVAADTSLPPKERAKQIAKALQIPVKDAYERVQRASMQSEDRLARAAALLAE